MSEQPSPGEGGKFDETLAKFPQLARARELFINLFQDRSPLINLGYTGRQIAFAMPVLRWLEEEGKVATHIRNNPYLQFEDPDEPDAEVSYIHHLPKHDDGYLLIAFRSEAERGWEGLSREQRLVKALTTIQPVTIFDDTPEQVAHIALFKEGADVNNLDYLVNQLFNNLFTYAPLGMRVESTLAKVARAIGAAGTFKAAWVDEEIKHEFVAKVDTPEDKFFGPRYVAYRKLRPVSDSRGSMLPVGKKANTSENKVTQILEARQQQIVSGQLSLGGAKI